MIWGIGLALIAAGVVLIIYAMQDLWPIAPLPVHPGEKRRPPVPPPGEHRRGPVGG